MTSPNLDNLVKIKKLKAEPPDQKEFNGLVRSAQVRLKDAQIPSLSIEGRFDLVYNAAHALALAALRWHGYRSDNRYLVFQCLPHTLGLDNVVMQVLDKCHHARNRLEYQGEFDITESMLDALLDAARELHVKVQALGKVNK
jgi:hypothetical protein